MSKVKDVVGFSKMNVGSKFEKVTTLKLYLSFATINH